MILSLVFFILPMANAACINPAENIEIKENKTFCYGIYNLENGIKIVNDDVVVDCNNSVLTGDGIGYGILLKDEEDVVVKNCNITNYEIGIYLDNSSSSVLKNNYLTKNKFGIALQNSIGNDINENNFFGNIQDKIISNITLQQEKNEEAISSKKVINKDEGNESYPPENQAAKYHGNKGLGYYIIYLAVFLAAIVAFYSLYYRFYYERRKLK